MERSWQSCAETALFEDLERKGARIKARSGVRPDGVRGLFATEDFAAEGVAVWVANADVLSLDTCDAELRKSIDAVLASTDCSDMERTVYAKMIAICSGYLFEQAKGEESSFRAYVASLPEAPPTINTCSPEEREALTLMRGTDMYQMYQHLVDLCYQTVKHGEHLWKALSPPRELPTRDTVNATFYFIQSRMSYMRLIPLIDLANCALPGQENSRIIAEGQDGCTIVTKKPVAAGEEIVIDYNHHDAIGMLVSYGCTLGLEHTRSVTRLRLALPGWLEQFGDPALSRNGAQLLDASITTSATGLEDHALLLFRMAALGSMEELIEAARSGFFDDSSRGPPEKVKLWKKKHCQLYAEIQSFCVKMCTDWEQNMGPAVAKLDCSAYIGGIAHAQYETDRRLLKRCESAMSDMQQKLEE